MIFWLGLIFAVPIIWGILHWGGKFPWNKRRQGSYSSGDAEGVTVVILSIAIFLFYLITGGIAFNNYSGLAKWEAFYEANTKNYEVAVDMTASYLSTQDFESKLISGSIEKLEQTGYISDRIVEWRDAVNKYNTTIASIKFYDSNWLTGSLVPDKVQDMKLLVIE